MQEKEMFEFLHCNSQIIIILGLMEAKSLRGNLGLSLFIEIRNICTKSNKYF